MTYKFSDPAKQARYDELTKQIEESHAAIEAYLGIRAQPERKRTGDPLRDLAALKAEWQQARQAVLRDRTRSDEWKAEQMATLKAQYDQRGREVARQARQTAQAQVASAQAELPKVARELSAARDWTRVTALQAGYSSRIGQAPRLGENKDAWVERERERLLAQQDHDALYALRAATRAHVGGEVQVAFEQDEKAELAPLDAVEGRIAAARINASLVDSAWRELETAINGPRPAGMFGGPSEWEQALGIERQDGGGVHWKHQPTVQAIGGGAEGGEVSE